MAGPARGTVVAAPVLCIFVITTLTMFTSLQAAFCQQSEIRVQVLITSCGWYNPRPGLATALAKQLLHKKLSDAESPDGSVRDKSRLDLALPLQ